MERGSTNAEADAPIIALDGPSGSGKGTVARMLAETLGWHLLDSGALYRLVGLAASRQGLLDAAPAFREAPAQSHPDPEPIAALAAALDCRFGGDASRESIFLSDEEVTDDIRTESAGHLASLVAAIPEVRAALLERQRGFARPPGLVADGRDMGSVVFPAAPVKVFLTASAKERARRRYKQLKEKGIDVSLRDLSRDIARRDLRDESRAIAPLRPAQDARVVDSTGITPEEVVAQVLEWLHDAGVGRAMADPEHV